MYFTHRIALHLDCSYLKINKFIKYFFSSSPNLTTAVQHVRQSSESSGGGGVHVYACPVKGYPGNLGQAGLARSTGGGAQGRVQHGGHHRQLENKSGEMVCCLI